MSKYVGKSRNLMKNSKIAKIKENFEKIEKGKTCWKMVKSQKILEKKMKS